tara:strand:+ start:280 stop:981 length:702 start_codon:yes stop_codon:yes gene_type:complete
MALPIISVPKYSVTIPSTGISVVYRPYLVKEEKILMIAMESEDQTQILGAVKEIIAACTFDKVKTESLALFDLEYIFLKLRSKSVGEVSKIGLKCKECETSNEILIDLDTIEVQGLDNINYTIMVNDNIGMKLRYPTVKDASILSKYTGVEAAMKTMIACIENIFDENKVYPAKDSTPKELEQFIDSLNSEQFKKLQVFFERMPVLSHKVGYTCSKCSTVNELVIKGLANFFG